ncbi:MAG TPA: hypothetical protein VNK95_19455 [Caldilineaceae bacterium]|nr:hypothetical protein [Caldilineaceae bacterium]
MQRDYLAVLARLVEVELASLDQADTAALAQQTAGRPLAPVEQAALYASTEGNPLFVVARSRT